MRPVLSLPDLNPFKSFKSINHSYQYIIISCHTKSNVDFQFAVNSAFSLVIDTPSLVAGVLDLQFQLSLLSSCCLDDGKIYSNFYLALVSCLLEFARFPSADNQTSP